MKSSFALNRKYGLQRSPNIASHPSYLYEVTELPKSVDLRDKFPQCYDQEQFNSCTANASAGCLHFYLGVDSFVPSRMYIYYNERVLQNTQNEDDGSSLQACIETLQTTGTVSESVWQYDQNHLYLDPSKNIISPIIKVIKEATLNSIEQVKHALSQNFPVLFGMIVYDSFESEEIAKSGIVPLPVPNEQQLGGHAVVAVGYDDEKQYITVRNSWSTGWGLNGYFMMPYSYFTNPDLCFDMWSIQSIQVLK